MGTAGIIAEYNPFHNGHAYHIERTRNAGCSHVVVVMGGCFTQRGEPACMRKQPRCEAALRNGADLVIELPVPWATASAETFAYGGVYLLNALGVVDVLSFGSESGNTSALTGLAAQILSLDGSESLAAALRTGVSFPRAREIALAKTDPDSVSLLRHPNDILAVEYLKAAARLGSRMRPLAVLRSGSGHDDPLPGGTVASASHIRRLLTEEPAEKALRYVPESAAAVYRREIAEGHAPLQSTAAETAVLSYLRRLGARDFAALPDVCEGLENRIAGAVRRADSLDGLCAAIKSKRYTLSRIRRIVLSAFLGIDREIRAGPPPYIRVLGMTRRGAELLDAARPAAALPIVSRHADFASLGERARRVYALECLASDLYGLCLPRRLPGGDEQRARPVYFTEQTVENDRKKE